MPNYTKISTAILCATFSAVVAKAETKTPPRETSSRTIRKFEQPLQEFTCHLKCGTRFPTDDYIYVRPENLRQYFWGKLGIRASDTIWLYRSPTDDNSLAAKLVFDMKGEPFLILQPPATAKSLDNLYREDLEQMWGKPSTNATPYSSFSLYSKENYRVEIQTEFKQRKLAKYRVQIETFQSPWAILDESKPDGNKPKSDRLFQSNNL